MDRFERLIGNELISKFMGIKPSFWTKRWFVSDYSVMKYHSDWNLLMQVVEKICKLKIGQDEYVEYSTFVVNKETGQIMVRFNGFSYYEGDTPIEATFLAVVNFIKWYKLYNEI
jgi:hypothetical protein